MPSQLDIPSPEHERTDSLITLPPLDPVLLPVGPNYTRAARLREEQRLRAVERSELLDSGDEERFDRITRAACRQFGVLTAMVSLIADDRQYLKSVMGWHAPHLRDVRNVPRQHAFCNLALQDEQPLVVPDTLADPRFRTSPFVLTAPFVRFYAGVPLRGPGGWFVGSICILDVRPRAFGEAELHQLLTLAAQAELEVNAPGRSGRSARPIDLLAGPFWADRLD